MLMHEKYTSKDFIAYKNPNLGFTIGYPSDWQRVDKPVNINTLVSFYSPFLGSSDTFRENVIVTVGKYSQKGV
jgi:hypothetical protein